MRDPNFTPLESENLARGFLPHKNRLSLGGRFRIREIRLRDFKKISGVRAFPQYRTPESRTNRRSWR